MKLKLTNQQFFSIYTLLQKSIALATPTGMQAIVLHEVLSTVYKKFYHRAFDKKAKYTVALSSAEACAWWIFFQQYPFTPEQLYEQTIIQTINNLIHQQFA